MFDIYCTICEHEYIVGTASLTAFANTASGPVGHAACPHGHDVAVDFRSPRVRPVAA